MSSPRTRFYLDKQNKKWLGVCAGISDYTGLDVTLVRIGFILLTLFGSGVGIIAYLVTAWMAPVKPQELTYSSKEDAKFWQGVRTNPRRTARLVRSRIRDIDRRLADVEAYVTSSHGRLSREIENLR
ncbi:MAG TPA: envelope stress response membrane protein PspC [Allosphingosinicella sp.]|jgi:phage shock protein C|nr:envelope stress response membrane protein PspC [Allosphingosinicella sp.]